MPAQKRVRPTSASVAIDEEEAAAHGLASLATTRSSQAARQGSAESSSAAKRRRPHATRSCLACRKRKVRCILANTSVPSSLTPLASEDACTRCRKMELKCIVWDGSRKGKRYTVQGIGEQVRQVSRSSSRALSEAQARQDGPTQYSVPGSRLQGIEILSPFYPYNPSFKPAPDADRSSDGDARERSQHSDDRQTSPESQADSFPAFANARDFDGCVRFMSMLRRPLLLHAKILARQDLFRCGTPPGPQLNDRSASAQLKTLLDAIPTGMTDVCDLGLLMHHAHLPRLSEVIEAYRAQPSSSRALLVCTMMYLSRIWQADPGRYSPLSEMPTCLPQLIRFYGQLVFMRTPRCLEAAQSLELLAAYMPFVLQGNGAAESDGQFVDDARRLYAGEDCSATGASFIAVALSIASALGCDPETGIQPDGTMEDVQRRQLLWASLCCWQMSLGFHEHHAGTSRKSVIVQSFISPSPGSNDRIADSSDTAVEMIHYAARAALKLRCRSMLRTSESELEMERAVSAGLPDEEFKNRQTAITDAYLDAVQRLAAQRLATLDSILCKLAECGEQKRAHAFVPMLQHTWHWLEMDARGLHQILLSKALGNVHVQTIRKAQRKGRQSHLTGSGERLLDAARTLFKTPIWTSPIWGQHVSDLGVRRNRDIVELLSRACRFEQLTGTHQHAIQSLSRPNCPPPVISLLLPMPLLTALLMSAAKALLDMQLVVLRGWHHVHADTDTFVVVIRQLASVLEHDMDLPVEREDGTREIGLAQCTAGILRIAADTMVDWQERQSLVLVRHHEQRAGKRAVLGSEDRSPPSTVLSTPDYTPGQAEPAERHGGGGSSINAAARAGKDWPHDPTLTADPLLGTAGLFDGPMPSIDSLFAGIMDIPEWNELIHSLEQQHH